MVDIVIQLALHFLTAALYSALGFHFWHTRWRQKEGKHLTRPMQTWERASIGIALTINASALACSLYQPDGLHFSFSLALSLMMALAVLIYWLESFMARMEGMQPLVLPLAALCALSPAIFSQAHLIDNTGNPAFKWHFLAAMLAYSLITLAALHAIFMGFAERALHQKNFFPNLTTLPPLLTMESLLFRILLAGFLLLTATVGSGVFFSEALFGKPFTLNHKTIFAIISWGIFAILIAGRHFAGWRGKRALRWTLSGFSVLLLAYIGSRFVAEVILGK